MGQIIVNVEDWQEEVFEAIPGTKEIWAQKAFDMKCLNARDSILIETGKGSGNTPDAEKTTIMAALKASGGLTDLRGARTAEKVS